MSRGHSQHYQGNPGSASQGKGSWLANVEVIEVGGEEQPLLVFEDPVLEREYREHFLRMQRPHDILGLLVSLAITLAFSSRASFDTPAAQVLLRLVFLVLSLSVLALLTIWLAPSMSVTVLRPYLFLTSWALHLVIGCLPPLTYHSLKPTTTVGTYMLLLANSRFVQNLFAMGLRSGTGFLGDTVLLTFLLVMVGHWNAQECQLLCSLQPVLAERYKQLGRILPFLTGGEALASAPAICVATRQLLQATLGCALPLGLGLYREVALRTDFAVKHGVRLARLRVMDVLRHAGIAAMLCMATIAFTFFIMDALPLLEDLPNLLRYGTVVAS